MGVGVDRVLAGAEGDVLVGLFHGLGDGALVALAAGALEDGVTEGALGFVHVDVVLGGGAAAEEALGGSLEEGAFGDALGDLGGLVIEEDEVDVSLIGVVARGVTDIVGDLVSGTLLAVDLVACNNAPAGLGDVYGVDQLANTADAAGEGAFVVIKGLGGGELAFVARVGTAHHVVLLFGLGAREAFGVGTGDSGL